MTKFIWLDSLRQDSNAKTGFNFFLLLEESDSVVDALYNTTKLKAKS